MADLKLKSDHHDSSPGTGVTEPSFLDAHPHPPPQPSTTTTMVMDPEKTHAEDFRHHDDSRSMSAESLRLDSNGLPLVPQPSRFKDDPLVRPSTCHISPSSHPILTFTIPPSLSSHHRTSHPSTPNLQCLQCLYPTNILTLPTELAILAKMGRPNPSRLHGLPRTLQRRPDQPIPRPPQRRHARISPKSSLQHHDRYNHRRRLALHLDSSHKLLRPPSRHAAGHPIDDPWWCWVRSIA